MMRSPEVMPEPSKTTAADEPEDTVAPTYRSGEMVLARDDDTSMELDVCKITHVTDTVLTLHCWETTNKNPAKASYKPAFIDKHGRTLLRKPSGRMKASPFLWDISIEDAPVLIPVRGIRMRKGGQLTVESLAALAKVRPVTSLRLF
jgi:hypothetical protein